MNTRLALLSAALCCLLASCNGVGDENPPPARAELTDEFRAYLALRETEYSESARESAGGYEFEAENGRLRITGGDGAEVWRSNEEWYVDSFRTGDVNRDGILDVAFVVWKSFRFGSEHPSRMANDDASVRCHLYVYSVKNGRVQQLWCSSSLPRPIYSFELDENGEQTPVLSGVRLTAREGIYTEDYSETSSTEYIYAWSGWGFTPASSAADADGQPEPEPAPAPAEHTATLAVVGDLMCHRAQYEDALAKGGGDTYDFDYMFKYIAPYISAADCAIGNFETTVTLPGNAPSDFPFFSSPPSFAEAIKNAGFDLLTTANNHTLDYGKEGLLYTIETLDALGIRHIGTYKTESDGEDVAVIDVNGVTFAVLAYTYGTNGNPVPPDMMWSVDLIDDEKIANDIASARALNPDFVLVMPHMGEEYETAPREEFKEKIHKMLQAGADIVLASHPHVLQPVEFITVTDPDGEERRCFVAYSLGNFVSSQRAAPRDCGVIVNLSFSKNEGEKATLDAVELAPVWVMFTNSRGAYDITVLPVYDLDKPELREAADKLSAKSAERVAAVKKEFAEMFPEYAR
jgi:poly-gamma-glutamate synthesis protein (capsule biosynthesis protein)